MQATVDLIVNFTTVSLGIFIEAVPFLLLGTLASGLVEVLISRDTLARILPRNPVLGAVAGGLMGLIFPVGECGVAPLTRRLLNKGLPASAGIAFLLAAPIINPVVIASTYAAYGWSTMLAARIGLGLAVAVSVGAIFALKRDPLAILRMPTGALPDEQGSSHINLIPNTEPLNSQLRRAARIAADEFFEMGQFLVAGSMLAALMQTAIPQRVLLALASGPVASVAAMQTLAFLLSMCSTVDAFISLSFVNTFSRGAILAFLVYGPMVDIKSTIMFLRVFKGKYAAYLVVLPLLMVMLAAVFANLNLNW